MQNTTKYLVKTDKDKTYILYIMNAGEYSSSSEIGRFVGLFLFYDQDKIRSTEELWSRLRHRLLFENSVDAIKEKVKEYASGRNENIEFLEIEEQKVF